MCAHNAPVEHADPDFAALDPQTRETILGAIVCGTSAESPLTETQDALIRALAHSVLGVEWDHETGPVSPAAFERAVKGVAERTRTRIGQFFVMLELVLDPLPPAVVESVDHYLSALGIEEGHQSVARAYANEAYGLALQDIIRKGYFGDFHDHPEVARKMHVHKTLTRPFEVVDQDDELLSDWKRLEHCEEGTLGRAIHEFYLSRGFVFPGGAGSVSPTLAQHDWVHVLADYGTVIESELEVFGFIAAAIPDPKGFSFLAAIISLFETGRVAEAAGGVLVADKGHLSEPGVPQRLADALRRGRICNQDLVYGLDYFDYVDRPLGEVREALGIVPKAPEAVEAGSAAVNDPAGITPYQREHGDARYQPPEAQPG